MSNILFNMVISHWKDYKNAEKLLQTHVPVYPPWEILSVSICTSLCYFAWWKISVHLDGLCSREHGRVSVVMLQV